MFLFHLGKKLKCQWTRNLRLGMFSIKMLVLIIYMTEQTLIISNAFCSLNWVVFTEVGIGEVDYIWNLFFFFKFHIKRHISSFHLQQIDKANWWKSESSLFGFFPFLLKHMLFCILIILTSFQPVSRVERSPSGGLLPKPLRTASSPQPATPGATELSCGRWCPMERGHTGRCPTRMWVLPRIHLHLFQMCFKSYCHSLPCFAVSVSF